MIVARSKNGRRLGEELRATAAAINPELPIVSTRSAAEYTSLGVLAGAGAANGATAYLFGVAPLDPAAFGVAVAVFTVVGLIACYAPARRAAAADPIVALRAEYAG